MHLFHGLCESTCLRNTWQYCPLNSGPSTDRHSLRDPGLFTFPPITSLPILPNASYTTTTSGVGEKKLYHKENIIISLEKYRK